ncbi:helix-turn-helix transcriptional regulator [[Enterobacter] lignolyticus]|uniref:HTH luxR-type domain-containing protein n=1 Tax=[Enterobacter] lignolyticus TaxID=1334193 RepID=A0A806XC58_9ENTR|nr:LuxR C-terminal-related transcriptional regulator [[Enterobacter] lignolyticus]ALR76321.1 hypothetical protein AO703_08435 [[Enterobacter] lignolyticus]
MQKILILSRNTFYTAGLQRLIREIAGEQKVRIRFLAPQLPEEYRKADIILCDVPEFMTASHCQGAPPRRLRVKGNAGCRYIDLYETAFSQPQPPGDRHSASVTGKHSLARVRGILRDHLLASAPSYCHQAGERFPALNARECLVLRLTGQGLSLAEVAQQTGFTDKSVSYYRSSIMRKLNIRGAAGLYRYALYFSSLLAGGREES